MQVFSPICLDCDFCSESPPLWAPPSSCLDSNSQFQAIGFLIPNFWHTCLCLSAPLNGFMLKLGFPGASDDNESACDMGDLTSIPVSGRSLGDGNGKLLQYPCLEDSMDRGAWQVYSLWSHKKRYDWATNTTANVEIVQEEKINEEKNEKMRKKRRKVVIIIV